MEGLLARYRELTDHNPDLQDPIIKAVKDDWEELLGQVENLIEDREQALQAAKDLQARENEVDEDLEKYINELEKIESADVATVQKSAMMKVRLLLIEASLCEKCHYSSMLTIGTQDIKLY